MPTHNKKTGALTHEGMVAAVKSGGSFIHNGNIISRLDDPNFPSAASLAAETGDQSEVDKVRSDNEALIAKLKAENAALKAGKPVETETPVADAPPVTEPPKPSSNIGPQRVNQAPIGPPIAPK